MKILRSIALISSLFFAFFAANAQNKAIIKANEAHTAIQPQLLTTSPCASVLTLDKSTAKLHNPDHSISTKAITGMRDGAMTVVAHDNLLENDYQWLVFPFRPGHPTGKITGFTIVYSVEPSPNNDAKKCYISQSRMVQGSGVAIGTVRIDDPTDLTTGHYKEHTAKPAAPFLCSNDYKTVMLKLVMSRGDYIRIHRVAVHFDCPTDPCALQLPNPRLAFAGKEDYTTESGSFTRYKLKVTNYDIYPNAMFVASPELPACGANANSSRTWVDIFDENGRRLYGFCALGNASNLKNLWFAVPKGGKAPKRVMIKMIDRKCGKTYASNWVSIP
jgi:hypothetical protein